ncbi:LysR family transcriptional regulator [Polaromonas sp.]
MKLLLGSFSIAANRLHVTQSSRSKRIVELEESVGAQTPMT